MKVIINEGTKMKVITIKDTNKQVQTDGALQMATRKNKVVCKM